MKPSEGLILPHPTRTFYARNGVPGTRQQTLGRRHGAALACGGVNSSAQADSKALASCIQAEG